MQITPSFTIYNASAGSGKTYTLVKEYLKILYQSNSQDQFKRILAITFTNKAVGEMKERIIEMLKVFSSQKILETPHSMFESICKELDIAPRILHTKSVQLLDTILHNYAAFDISTIDGFTHRLIRTFAYDLKLPLNFEVELDQNTLLNEAVDRLIANAGINKELTKVIVDFAIEKADDDRSWDVSLDFYTIAKLLINESHIPYLNTLKDKSIEDFKALKATLTKHIKTTENDIIEKATSALNLIETNGLEFSDFSRSTLPNHFKKASELHLDRLYDNKLGDNLSEKSGIYTTKLDATKAATIDALLPKLETLYHDTKQAIFHLKFLKAFHKNMTPLSVLNAINKELIILKEEQNKMLISEFNTIISNEIKNQPTPFIYERMGEKFNHYFIDEFQDTSVLQWQNLVPLLDNSLSSDKGSSMLVGDAKQAIYRWRGGKAEQFIDLYNEKNKPFQISQKVENLPINYRSFKDIVEFNNAFFSYLSNSVFSKEDYQLLYKNAVQTPFSETSGYVNLTFLDINKEDSRDELYPEKVLAIIEDCLANNYHLSDICILVRKKKEGVAIADYLSQHQIDIMSSETLLIQNASEVIFTNNILSLILQPNNKELKIGILNHLASSLKIKNKHHFFAEHIDLPINQLFKSFEALNIFIESDKLLQLSLYELAETIIRQFNLVKTSNAYIQFYLDFVLEYSQKKGSDIAGFLNHFERKKESLSIVSPIGQNAVQIMTIHKSKGLEFPVVIFPYADLDMYREIDAKEWFPINPERYHGFSCTLLNYNKDFENYGENGLSIYNNHQSELELDNINLLYVALTRPIEQLYIITKKENETKEGTTNKKYSGLFINYLKHLNIWNKNESTYTFGIPQMSKNEKISETNTFSQQEFISSAKKDHNIKIVANSGHLWDSTQQDAIEKGNLIHNMMSLVNTTTDVGKVVKDYMSASIINEAQAKTLNTLLIKIVEHPKLINYYKSDLTIYNERDIITKEGVILRPDRIVINTNNEAVIIDYKTGAEDIKHKNQLIRYQNTLQDMQFTVIKKILIYINNDVQIIEI
jgi:ATP-dependent exoDNAse (exonuclease V) beta subunit